MESVCVKIQYFHDALMSQIDNIDAMLISRHELSIQEHVRLNAKKNALEDILERYEDLFENVLYIEK